MTKKRIRGQLFTISATNSVLSDDYDDRPIQEERIKTYRITKYRDKFTVYEMQRKKNPKRIKTFKAKKGEKLNDGILRVKSGQIKFRILEVDRMDIYKKEYIHTKTDDGEYKTLQRTTGKKIGRLDTIQTNYFPRTNVKLKQLVCLVRVEDTRRGIIDYYIGYSKNRAINRLSMIRLREMEGHCIDMAIGKFIKHYGKARKSGDLTAVIIERRWQYRKRYGKYKKLREEGLRF